jgi:hypothetical protein
MNVRWLIAIGIACLAVAFLYLGVVAPISSLFQPAPTSSAEASGSPLSVESSKIAPTAQAHPPDLPMNIGNGAAPASSSLDGPNPPRHRTSKSLGKLARRQFVAAVNGLGARLASCPDRQVQQGVGTSPFDDQGIGQFTVLVLDVSTHDGKMEVVDVSQQSNGSLSAAFVSCAQRMLRGEVVPAPSGREAERTQYAIFLGPAMPEAGGGPDTR